MTWSIDLGQFPGIEYWFRFYEIVVWVPPACVMSHPKRQSEIDGWIDHGDIIFQQLIKICECGCFTANQIIQAMKKPATQRIAVGTFFWM